MKIKVPKGGISWRRETESKKYKTHRSYRAYYIMFRELNSYVHLCWVQQLLTAVCQKLQLVIGPNTTEPPRPIYYSYGRLLIAQYLSFVPLSRGMHSMGSTKYTPENRKLKKESSLTWIIARMNATHIRQFNNIITNQLLASKSTEMRLVEKIAYFTHSTIPLLCAQWVDSFILFFRAFRPQNTKRCRWPSLW